jgi:hypothetical protein
MDRYSLNARIYPIIIFYMPAVILTIIFSFKFDNYIHLLTSFGIVSALSYLFSQLGRDAGKKKERKLWESWGGTPTTQLLRWSNTEISINTKRRYHAKLNLLCPVDGAPDNVYERANPLEADEVYQTWTKYLISRTRDTNKFPLLFKDNISYGFRRNLWGLKAYAILLIIVLMTATYGYYSTTLNTFNISRYPVEFSIAEGILLIMLSFWLIKIKGNWIRIPAFSYAERLLESVEDL